jgi:hypothetical protein
MTQEMQDLAELEEENRLVNQAIEEEIMTSAPAGKTDFSSFFDNPTPTAPVRVESVREEAKLVADMGLVRKTSIRNTWTPAPSAESHHEAPDIHKAVIPEVFTGSKTQPEHHAVQKPKMSLLDASDVFGNSQSHVITQEVDLNTGVDASNFGVKLRRASTKIAAPVPPPSTGLSTTEIPGQPEDDILLHGYMRKSIKKKPGF